MGPFTFTGVCENKGGTKFAAPIKVTTTAANSFFFSEEADFYRGDFQPGGEAIASEYAESEEPEWLGYYGYYNEFAAASPDGATLLQGYANSGVHVFGADCAFQVSYVNGA